MRGVPRLGEEFVNVRLAVADQNALRVGRFFGDIAGDAQAFDPTNTLLVFDRRLFALANSFAR